MPESVKSSELEQYIIDHLDEAIEKHYIKPYFQPVIRTVSRQLCGMEALARWDDPKWGLLPPGSFIDVLERHRKIHLLDACIIRQVCMLYREAVQGRGVLIPVSINLSRLDYELCDIFAVVEKAVQANMMPRSFLCIEITESALNDNAALMHQYIDRFRNAGYQVWMDDFGSGYSSLNVLKDFLFDELKVDMWFLSDFHQRSRKILSSIVHMAKEIEIQTLVEGVETEEQFRFLRNIGFEKVQGYLFGQPMPYMDCIRHVLEQGLSVEAPMHRGYYDQLGRLDVLSATPFLSPEDRKSLISGRELNSIPLAVLELREDTVRLLLTNDSFDEASGAIDWLTVFGNIETDPDMRDAIRLRDMSAHLEHLLEEARSTGNGKMYFVDSGEYFELQAKRIAGKGSLCSVLLRLDNLSRGAEIDRQQKLDEGLRAIYALFDQVAVMDIDKMSFTPLYADAKEVQSPREEDLRGVNYRYSEEWIYPEDRQRFLLLTDPATLAERVTQSGRGYVSAHLRTRLFHGNFTWKLHTILHVRDSIYFMLVREAQSEVMDFFAISGARPDNAEDTFKPASLWQNFTLNSALKFFWKDRDRRFMGASRSFLDFYGFQSMNAILHKTDEDMGWHLHADAYQSDEWSVIREGVSTHNVPGSCIIRGENQRIVASKMPLYSRNGQIEGLLGYFFQVDEFPGSQSVERQSRLDTLTGLLNARGLADDLYSYQDEYELRKIDFARIHISVKDFDSTNEKFGYDFGDSVIRAVGNSIMRCCGATCSVARFNGSNFVVLTQFHQREELDSLVSRLREVPKEIHVVDGVPFSPYLSFGAAVYSETKSIGEQASQAEARMSADNTGVGYSGELVENVGDLFRMYEHLPIAFAVYHMPAPEQDAVVLYANRTFLERNNYTRATLLGKTVRETFPMTGERWYDMARRAAFDGETSEKILYYALTDLRLYTTAMQVIGPGYCAFTYQWDVLPSPDIKEYMEKHPDRHSNLVIDDSTP
ncbi:MAG: EAL domain-containing protein [Oscillospiraceae bacterium]|nr:EAL domain-containing protein [Oscillospiraceae bacterium]